MAECRATAQLRSDEDEVDTRCDEHLADLPDGAGCTDIWEYLSDRREADDD